MLIDTNTKLVSLQGNELKDNDGTGNVIDATFKLVVVNAILAPVQNESGTDKVRKYELAKRIYKNDEVDLDEKEIALIKERVGELFPPLVCGQIYELLRV